MRLVPVTGTLAAVAKVEQTSPEAARLLVQLGLFESLSDQIEAHRHVIEPVMLANMEAVTKRARARLLGEHVGRVISGQGEPDDLEVARELAVMDQYVQKGLVGWIRDQFEREHPRDQKGRFMSREVRSGDPNTTNLTTRQKTAHDSATSVARQWKNAQLIDENTKIQMVLRRVDENGKNLGEPLNDPKQNPKVSLKELEAAEPDELDRIHAQTDNRMLLHGLQVSRNDIKMGQGAQRAGFDVMSAMTGNDIASARLMRGIPFEHGHARPKLGQAAADWHGLSGTAGGRSATDRKAYRRMALTGQALQGISAPGSSMGAVGGLAQLMGDLGPEAEKVIGPGIRLTAYRFRGTERRPDNEVISEVRAATKYADAIQDQQPIPAPAPGEETASLRIAAQHMGAKGARESEDQRALTMRGDAAVAYLLGVNRGPEASHLPSKQLTELSMASGEVPPSEGVLIDERGRVAAQAVGYNGDHYLPFDLRNLNRLFGGQYVRTRAAGGLSTEDIYTGLATGARQVQVVSNSGVFTIEFDPALRGARRFNDKVKRMVTRYGEILEAVASKELMERDFSPEEMGEMRRNAMEGARTDKQFQDNLRDEITSARLGAKVGSDSDEAIEEAAVAHAASKTREEASAAQSAGHPLSPQQIAAVRDDFHRQYVESKRQEGARTLRLDGPGYDRAMRALKQEFPYYIRRASWESLPDWLEERGLRAGPKYTRHYAADRARAAVGQTNPALAGVTELSRAKAARRAVPTVQAAREETEGEGEGTQTPRAAGGERTPAAAGARPGRAPAGLTTEEAKAEIAKPHGKYQRAIADAVRDSFAALDTQMNEKGAVAADNDEEAMVQGAHEYAHWKWHQLKRQGGNANENFASWLAGTATDQQRKLVLSAVSDIADTRDQLYQNSSFTAAKIRSAGKKVAELVELAAPFGDTFSKDNLRVDQDEPRPFAFAHHSHLQPYEASQFRRTHPEEYAQAKAFDGESDKAIASDINDHVNRLEDIEDPDELAKETEKVRVKHEAWAFNKSHEVANKLRGLGIKIGGGGAEEAAAGGAAPLSPGAQGPLVLGTGFRKGDARPRRQLLFHELEGTSVVKSHSVHRPVHRLRPVSGRRS